MATSTTTTTNNSAPTKLTSSGTFTQGQKVVDAAGNVGTVAYDVNTGKPLSAGQSTTSINASKYAASDAAAAQQKPVPAYGDQVKDQAGNVVGTAKFDPNTGQPLQQKAPIASPYQNPLPQQNPRAIQADQGTVPTTPGSSQDIGTRVKQGFATQGTTPVPQDAGLARGSIAQTIAPQQQQQDTSYVDATLSQDQTYNAILQSWYDQMNSQNQTTSLVDEYSKLSKSLGIDSINSELVNTQKIIDGTEDDIRSEVTATNGFASDSQVLAMANARNKSLIKNYNALLATRDNAQQQLQTMINLSAQDRQAANEKFNQQMNFGFQLMDYQNKMKQNATEGYNNVIKAVGYDGLYNSLKQDPYTLGVAEKTLGFQPGQMQYIAGQAAKERAKQNQMDSLDLQIKQSQLYGSQLSNKEKLTGMQGKFQASTPEASMNQIDTVNGLLSNTRGLSAAVGTTGFFGRGGLIRGAIGAKQDFTAGIQQLTSQLTLDSLINAKANGATFGALSEGELGVLSSTATKLSSWAKKDKSGNIIGFRTSEKNVINELNKINNFAKKDYILKGGDPSSVGVQKMPDGRYWAQNSDGSFTEIK